MDKEIRNLVITDELDIGSDGDSFFLRFKGKIVDSEDEFTAKIPLDGLKAIVLTLFKFGVDFQKSSQKEIGFGIGRVEGENNGEQTDL